jgi:hypothetical protein
LLKAGERYGEDIEMANFLAGWRVDASGGAQALAEALLARAVELDRGQPADDMSVVVLATLPAAEDRVRRLHARAPLEVAEWEGRREEDYDEDLG